jgi:endoglycosylceramidase
MLDPLPGWGINAIRFLFTWEAFEPSPCQFSDDYLNYYEQAVAWAEQRGIYVIVDFHQDGFSRYALNGCGEGAPDWAVTSRVALATPDNGPACVDWGLTAAFSPQNYYVFARFLKDDNQAYSHFVEMTRRVAARLSTHANVIGYDMLNEPWSNTQTMAGFYQNVGAAIREKHPGAMLLFEPALPLYGMLLPVDHSTITPPPFRNVTFAPHYYSPTIEVLGKWAGEDPGKALGQWKSQTDGWNTPMLLGEFGAPEGAGKAADYLEAVYQWLDQNFVSSTQWNYDPGWTPDKKDGWNLEDLSINDDNLQLRSDLFVPRPYPQKTAGKPVLFKRGANGFQYSWVNNPLLGKGRTEFYLPAGYADGKSWTVSPSTAHLRCTQDNEFVTACQSRYRGEISVSLSQ